MLLCCAVFREPNKTTLAEVGTADCFLEPVNGLLIASVAPDDHKSEDEEGQHCKIQWRSHSAPTNMLSHRNFSFFVQSGEADT